jgi:hypothetical protein
MGLGTANRIDRGVDAVADDALDALDTSLAKNVD